MRIDLEVLNSVDHIMTTSTRDSECVRDSAERESENRHENIEADLERDGTHEWHQSIQIVVIQLPHPPRVGALHRVQVF